jgi:hypothetical protein
MFIFGLKMEDVFIGERTVERFDFNSFWIANNSPTKRIAVRKIKVYKDSITCVVSFVIDGPLTNPVIHYYFEVSYTVNDKNSIIDFLNYLTERINIRLDEIFNNNEHFRIRISFSSNVVSFTSNIRSPNNGFF